MPLSAGDKLGPYEIVAPIGAGGMGEVYRARDSRLGRDVALKISNEKFTDRFEREARSIAAFSHPHICQLYDVGPNYLVMELIDGAPLKGPLRLERVLTYAKQILDALDAAHSKGITHRDLKPANILVTKSGIKLLDFGLAKQSVRLRETDATEPLTEQGAIVGTLNYMSPEQLQSKEADPRSDIFSFGLVLYEMLTGRRAFAGASAASVIAAILEREAPSVAEVAPLQLDRVLRTALEKDPEQRWQSARDLRIALSWSLDTAAGAPRRVKMHWAVIGALSGVLLVLSFLFFRQKPAAPQTSIRFQIPGPGGVTLGPIFNVSPDGKKLAFVIGGRLWVHFLDSGEYRDLTASAGSPVWSPDSRFIAYPAQGKIRKIDATGGVPQTISDIEGEWFGGAWNKNDEILFTEAPKGLFRVPATGGVPVEITRPDPARQEGLHARPFFFPDGRHFVYQRTALNESAIYVGSLDAKPEAQSTKPLVASDLGPVYAPTADPATGYLLFMQGTALMAQQIDNRSFELKGKPVSVADQVGDNDGIYGGFSASENLLVFWPSPTGEKQLTWFDQQGKVLGKVGEPDAYLELALSPDGRQLAASKRTGLASNIVLFDFTPGGTNTRFTLGSAKDRMPIWSPDGSRIVYLSGKDLYQKMVSGGSEAQLLLKSREGAVAESWSRDGRYLLYLTYNPRTKSDIWVLPLDGDRKPLPFLTTDFNEVEAHFSPDGRWVVYVSDESGHFEVYVRSFALNAAGTAVESTSKWQISEGGGLGPIWPGDGREIYYVSLPDTGRMMEVDISTGRPFRIGKPKPLGLVFRSNLWDSTDGKRFLFAVPAAGKADPYVAVWNWQARLSK